jgi:hypothetical protein
MLSALALIYVYWVCRNKASKIASNAFSGGLDNCETICTFLLPQYALFSLPLMLLHEHSISQLPQIAFPSFAQETLRVGGSDRIQD